MWKTSEPFTMQTTSIDQENCIQLCRLHTRTVIQSCSNAPISERMPKRTQHFGPPNYANNYVGIIRLCQPPPPHSRHGISKVKLQVFVGVSRDVFMNTSSKIPSHRRPTTSHTSSLPNADLTTTHTIPFLQMGLMVKKKRQPLQITIMPC